MALVLFGPKLYICDQFLLGFRITVIADIDSSKYWQKGDEY